MLNSAKVVLIAAGGTGGHVFPGLAVAELFKKNGVEVIWIGGKGLEQNLVCRAGLPFFSITVSGFREKSKIKKLSSILKMLLAILQAIKLIYRTKADAVLGMGGYVSFPVGVAAKILFKPLYLHEQNAIPGMSNKFLSPWAKLIFSTFPATFKKGASVLMTGNPVRFHSNASKALSRKKTGPLHLLVLGGSQGASKLNQVIPFLRQYFLSEQVLIWHQTGTLKFLETQSYYQALNLNENQFLKLSPFIENMHEAYAWSDLVLCRAGASTLAELTIAGVASCLVPFPFAVDDHQYHNALFLVKGGASDLILEKELTPEKLIAQIEHYLYNRHRLFQMAQCAKRLAKPQAAQTIVEKMMMDLIS